MQRKEYQSSGHTPSTGQVFVPIEQVIAFMPCIPGPSSAVHACVRVVDICPLSMPPSLDML